MPFDGSNFPGKRPRPEPGRPSDTAICLIIVVVAFSLLVMPISLQALVDLVKYIRNQ